MSVLTNKVNSALAHSRTLRQRIEGSEAVVQNRQAATCVLNFKSSPSAISTTDVPTLLPDNILKDLQAGDDEPYYKIQAIDLPAEGNGIYPHDRAIYTENFFRDFINLTKKRPIPGSKRGHEFTSRPSNDFYTIGGQVRDGKAFLKVYVPPEGDSTSNAGLKRDMKAGLVHFSLVSRPRYEVEGDVMYINGSAGAERNDAVEYGEGAMDQSVNSHG